MALFRTVGPAAEPSTIAELKQHIRLDGDIEDDLLESLIRAAREEVERSTGLALLEQSWRLTLDRWPRDGVALLMRHPVIEVQSVTAYGSEGEASLVDPAGYRLDAGSRPARLLFVERVEPLRTMNGIEIDFVAGFGDAADDAPELLRRAVLVLAAHWYEFRARIAPQDQPVSYPPDYERMIAGYRARRLA